MTEVRILPLLGWPEVREGDDLAALVAGSIELEDRDVVVLAQKVVSKSEGASFGWRTSSPRSVPTSSRRARIRGGSRRSFESRRGSCGRVRRS